VVQHVYDNVPTYGRLLVIQHGDQYLGFYGHSERILVALPDGSVVQRRQDATNSGVPVAKHLLSRSIGMWLDDTPLQTSAKQVSWYYCYGTGTTTAPDGAVFNPGLVVVGLPASTESNAFGFNSDRVGNAGRGWRATYDLTASSNVVAPGENGLSIRTLDDRFKVAIQVYPTGLLVAKDFK